MDRERLLLQRHRRVPSQQRGLQPESSGAMHKHAGATKSSEVHKSLFGDLFSCSQGSRRCGECPPGYQGNGETCIFMGPCHVGNGGCSPMAVCLATSGTVQCFCRPGYRGTGVGPVGCVPGSSVGPSPPDGDTGVVVSPCIREGTTLRLYH